jgi:hypothetical protein
VLPSRAGITGTAARASSTKRRVKLSEDAMAARLASLVLVIVLQ